MPNDERQREFISISRGAHRRGPRMPAEKPKNFKKTMARLWGFFGRERRLLTLIFLFVAVDSAVLLAVPFLTGRAVDAMTGGANAVRFGALRTICVFLFSVFVTDLVLTFLNNFLMAGVSQRIVRALRDAMFKKLLSLPVKNSRAF